MEAIHKNEAESCRAEIEPANFPNYKSGSWGPKAADELIAKDGRSLTAARPQGQLRKKSILGIRSTPRERRVVVPNKSMPV